MYSHQTPRLMTVTGDTNLSVAPDTVTVALSVVTEGTVLTNVQQKNAQISNRVIQALLQLGVERENIQTTMYTISPQYDYVDGRQVFRGYQVTHELTVKVKNVDQVGAIIDAAVQNGVNRVSDVQFTVSNREFYYRQALSQALRNAYAKAQTLADTMQLPLAAYPVKVVENVSEEPGVYKTFAAETMTTIEPGQLVIGASVEAKFPY